MPIWANGPIMPGTMGKRAPYVKGRGRVAAARRGRRRLIKHLGQ
jgi:hypothetical protein